MWRRQGDGEVYIYAPKSGQVPDLCSTPGTECDADAGLSLMRGAFKFVKGRWMKISITGGRAGAEREAEKEHFEGRVGRARAN